MERDRYKSERRPSYRLYSAVLMMVLVTLGHKVTAELLPAVPVQLAQIQSSTPDTGSGTTGSDQEAPTENAIKSEGSASPEPSTQKGITESSPSPMRDIPTAEIVGQTLYSSDGSEIGEIENVAISADAAQKAVIVDVGGFLGVGGRSIAIPLDQINIDGGRITTTLGKSDISKIRPYEEGGYLPGDPTTKP